MSEPQASRPVGRPSEYDPKYCDELEAFMAKGFSFTAFAGSIGVCRNTLDNWAAAHPEFLGARNRAKASRLLEWERKAVKVADGGGGAGASTMIAFGLKNMGDDEWLDKQRHEHTGAGGGPIKSVDLTNLSDERLAQLAEILGEAGGQPTEAEAG